MSSPEWSYKLQHTPSGAPFIELPTRSPTSIYLTPLKESDAEAMAAALSIEDLNNVLIGPPKPYTVDSAKWWISQQLSGKADLSMCAIRASNPETGIEIGSCSLAPHGTTTSIVREQKQTVEGEAIEVDLGYWLHPDYYKQGIMTAAVKAVIEWGRKEEGVGTVVVRAVEENNGSRAVIGKFPEFKKVEGEEKEIEWPESKGGGWKRIGVWEWKI